jgi:hypothetical protein
MHLLIENNGSNKSEHLTFFYLTDSDKSKAKIKPELLKIPLIKNLINKYGTYEAEAILGAVNLYINRDYYMGIAEERRFRMCKEATGVKVDIENCIITAEIINHFTEASLDSYDTSLRTLENILKDTSELLETSRVKIAIRRQALAVLEFSDVLDEEMTLKVEVLMSKIENDFGVITKAGKSVIELNKTLKELKTKANNSQTLAGSNSKVDPMLSKFDN